MAVLGLVKKILIVMITILICNQIYNSPSEVACKALLLWNEQQQHKKNMEVLRARLELAEQSSLIDNFSMADLIKELDSE
jgi:Bacterial antitoxin of ParD toxin-antitoxin type II system and RHH